jgi:biopolymer transport protein ExbD
MGMSAGSGSGDGLMSDINTTPLIDVMLCLLITIIYNVPPMTHAVKLDMPQASAPPPTQVKPEVVQIEIDFDGTILWNGNPVAGIEELERYLRSSAAQPLQPELHLLPDRRAKYEVVAKVLAAAQRHRMKKIGFVNTTQFRD